MRKPISILLILICLPLVAGCSGAGNNRDLNNSVIDSKVKYDLVIPTDSEGNPLNTFFSLPAYRLYTDDYLSDSFDEDDEFIGGENVKLEGENVDALNGMVIELNQVSMRDAVESEDEFIDNLKEYYQMNYDSNFDEDKFRGLAKSYINDYKILSIGMSYDGVIDKNVVVSSLSIPDIEFDYNFDSFTIRLEDSIDYNDSVKNDTGDIIGYEALGGVFVDMSLPKICYLHLAGTAEADIADISVASLNNNCEVITSSNYDNLSKSNDLEGVPVPSEYKDINKGEYIDSSFYYIFNDTVEDCDATVSNLYVEIQDGSGQKWGNCIYQPSVIDGPYLILKECYEALH